MSPTEHTSTAQGRFTVALPGELKADLDTIGKRLSDALREQTGVSIELTVPQILASLVKTAATTPEPAPAETPSK